MKFMSGPEQAAETMLFKPRNGYLTGDTGFINALNDIRLHQAALMAAVQPALSDMSDGLAPVEIEKTRAVAGLAGLRAINGVNIPSVVTAVQHTVKTAC